MKLIALFGMASLAALGATEQKADHSEHTADSTGSCCAPAQGEIRFSYLEVANPPAATAAKGAVTGKISFDGEAPKVEPLNIKKEAAEGCVDSGEVDPTDRSLLVSKDGGIANVVVTVQVKGAEVKVPDAPIKVDQMSCRYEPHVVLLPVGTTVEYLNSDKVSHNVHTYASRNDSLNKTIAPGSKETQKLEKEDKIEVKCDIHPWMSAYMYVTEDPYTTVTAADGSFTIPDVPAGEYKIEIWHEKLGKAKGEVKINEDGSSEAVSIKLGAEKKGGRGRR